MIKKEEVIKILQDNTCEVDNFNDAVFDQQFNNVAEEIVKLCNLHIVSQQRELLLAYEEWRCENPDKLGYEAEQYVDWYIKANNCG